jgi:NHL repeat
VTVDPKTNLMYIADGYGNRRVLIVDAATGKYVGHCGAYGQNPVMGENGGGPDVGEGVSSWPAEFKRGEMKPKFFRSPVHCAKLASDGLLYVCDRSNNRVQIFRASEAGKPCSNERRAGQMRFRRRTPRRSTDCVRHVRHGQLFHRCEAELHVHRRPYQRHDLYRQPAESEGAGPRRNRRPPGSRTIDGYEAMHLIRKGQIRWLPKGDVIGQRQFIHALFGIAA